MKVTCITPSTSDRAAFNERITAIFDSQDYEDKEHIILLGPGNVGDKRNQCITFGTGEIILHLDSDDLYASDWISKSVKALVESKADMVGLRSAWFCEEEGRLWDYGYLGGQPYAVGATMCYWRRVWERSPFKSVQTGEDLYFCVGKKIHNHGYKDGFTAILHGNNTCGHLSLSTKEMRAIQLSTAPDILKRYYSIQRPAHVLE